MDRTLYLQNRNSNQVSLELAYEYYVNIKPEQFKIPINIFAQVFPQYLSMFQPNMEDFFRFYDQKFEVVQMVDNKNKTTKYI